MPVGGDATRLIAYTVLYCMERVSPGVRRPRVGGEKREMARNSEVARIQKGALTADEAEALSDVKVFHSGTKRDGDAVVANGGRILCVTALGESLTQARDKAYEAVSRIRMPDSRFRTDIGLKGIRRLNEQQQEG